MILYWKFRNLKRGILLIILASVNKDWQNILFQIQPMHVLFSGYGYCIVLHILFFCNIMLTKGFNILLLPLFFEHNSFSFPTILILILLNCYVVCNRIRSWICQWTLGVCLPGTIQSSSHSCELLFCPYESRGPYGLWPFHPSFTL